MPATSAASLALAARLRDRSDDELAALITSRSVSPGSVKDIFDLAEALLDAHSVDAALAGLGRRSLAALATAAEHHDEPMPLAALAEALECTEAAIAADLSATDALALCALEPAGVTVWPPVGEALAAWPERGLPSAEQLRSAPAPAALAPVDDTDRRFLDRGAAERAFTTATRIAEIVAALVATPARMLAKGGMSLPDAKRLAEACGAELDEIPLLLDLAAIAGLVHESNGRTLALDDAEDWRRLPLPARWARLADAWVSTLPDELHRLLADRVDARWGDGIADFVAWLYPAADEALLIRLRRRGAQGDRLGIAVDGRPSSVGAALVAHGAEAAAAALAPLVPTTVDKVYLQHDLTVVSPGPLDGGVDEQLRRMAELESAGLAGRYRITAETLGRAIAQGETADALLAFLAGISLTGVPQPLEYLVRETARRYGTIRVAGLAPEEMAELGARTAVRSDDAGMLDALLVDTAAAPLGLVRVGPHRLVSRLEPAVVLWTLIDARYPAAPEGGAMPLERPRRGAVRTTVPTPVDAVAAAVGRMRESSAASGPDSGGAWVVRQWELAIRGKLGVRATVRMPDGVERSFDLEPTGAAAGRVRGRDRVADVERTLPVSSITALEPLD